MSKKIDKCVIEAKSQTSSIFQEIHLDAELEEKRWQETLLALQSVEQGLCIPGEVMMKWLESWGTENELKSPEI